MRSGNIRPGVVVDRDIVHKSEFDFYMNSHAGLKGTNRPGKYCVLGDEVRGAGCMHLFWHTHTIAHVHGTWETRYATCVHTIRAWPKGILEGGLSLTCV